MNDAPAPGAGAPSPPPEAGEVFGDRLGLAQQYADLLATTGIAHGLVGPREAPRLWERHLVNCAVMESLVPHGETVIDIGSGAGLPGIVLGIARPDLTVHLVEPLLRRTTWLHTALQELGLGNVTIHRGRAQEMQISAPVVTARAVASLDKLVRWSFPLLSPSGRLLALKGESAEQELRAAAGLLERMAVQRATLHVIGEGRVSEPVRVVEIVRPEHLDRGRATTVKKRPARAEQRAGRRARRDGKGAGSAPS